MKPEEPVWEQKRSPPIVVNLKARLRRLLQITQQNSRKDYSWSGADDTAEKNKTASITMRLF